MVDESKVKSLSNNFAYENHPCSDFDDDALDSYFNILCHMLSYCGDGESLYNAMAYVFSIARSASYNIEIIYKSNEYGISKETFFNSTWIIE